MIDIQTLILCILHSGGEINKGMHGSVAILKEYAWTVKWRNICVDKWLKVCQTSYSIMGSTFVRGGPSI